MTRRTLFSTGVQALAATTAAAATIPEPPKKHERRFAIMRVSVEAFEEIFSHLSADPKRRRALRLEGIPDGAKMRRVGFDVEYDSFSIVLEHFSFAPVGEGCEIPAIPVTWRYV